MLPSPFMLTKYRFIASLRSILCKILFSLLPKIQMFNHLHTMISPAGRLFVLESVDSTNNYAMARVREGGASHGDAFFAQLQEKGKGQRGKAWHAERGANIILSTVLKPGLPLQQQFTLSMAVAIAATDFFSRYAGEETVIKWPNDVYWRDRKAGGILIENIIGTAPGGEPQWQWAIVGTGININQTSFPENIRNPVSLKQITGKEWPVTELAEALRTELLRATQQLPGDLLAQYNERLYRKALPTRFKQGNRVFEATVKHVDENGALHVTAGIEQVLPFGSVEWLQ